MAQRIEELLVYQQAMDFCVAVTALTDGHRRWRNRRLQEQIADANDSILANICEGFEQPTDAAFAQYLFHARGSLAEVLARLRTARARRYITDAELQDRTRAAEALSRQLGAFIRYLDGCGWKDCGRFRSRQRNERFDDGGTP